MFNLIQESWIPVFHSDRSPTTISPWQVTDYPDNPIISLATPRPDFNGSMAQFLIGLIQTTMPPEDPREWRRKFFSPPSPDELRTAFERYRHVFNLDGEGPRFMQDPVLRDGDSISVNSLFIEMPGENTLRRNADLFLKRGTIQQICFSCAAMALHCLQTNAPTGGKGHRTSIRGGGPLTTLVMGNTLWETVWLNVLISGDFLRYGNSVKTTDPDIFPWMGTSLTEYPVTRNHVHPAHMFWGMPRRIHLNLESLGNGICDVCGNHFPSLIKEYYTAPHGMNYKGGWRHTLTPYSFSESRDEPNPRKGQQGGIAYRHWLGMVQPAVQNKFKYEPSITVQTFIQDRQGSLTDHLGPSTRLWAFGYEMDNMKARGWNEGTMPLIHVNPSIREKYEYSIEQIIRTSEFVAYSIGKSIRRALFHDASKISGDLSFIDTEFWQGTEEVFFLALGQIQKGLENGQSLDEPKTQFLESARRVGFQIFDRYSQANFVGEVNPVRIALARRDLASFTSSSNERIRQHLGLPVRESPTGKTPGKKKTKSGHKSEV
jgi:CRISPR system Cascade subunit CasA